MPKVTKGAGPSNARDPIDAPARDHLLNSVAPEVQHLVNEVARALGHEYVPSPLHGPDAADAA